MLFVDDDPYILSALKRAFSDKDINLILTDNPRDALAMLNEEDIAVLVSDNCMPDMTGIELLSLAKELSPDTVKILMTAYADLHTAINAINSGEVFKFITKPWENEHLIDVVEEGMRRYHIIQTMKKGDEGNLLSLAQTIELKDPYTRGHCDRVAKYALLIAEALDLPQGIRADIKYGSWLHDCGKIGIPETILNKPGRLEEEEMEIIKKHPAWGAEVARFSCRSDTIVNIILYHHEKFDGTGYPTGKKGKDIPIEARIVSIADIFDALTSNRPYREAFSSQKAFDIMSSMRGTALDPKIFDLFLSLNKTSNIFKRQTMDNADVEIPVKLLLVDDEENILHSLKRLLMEENLEVLTANSGEKALSVLQDNEDIGLIISDQRMPGFTGVDFLEKAKQIRPLAVRILLTGYSDINAAIDAINRGGASKYLTKPWKDEELIMSVREACQRYVLVQKNRQLSALIQQKNEELKQWSQELEIMVQEHTIELTRQNDRLKKINELQDKNFKSIIASLSSLIELRDTNVKSHSRNVAEISTIIATDMGLSKDETETIFVGAMLHDIGKIGLADSILDKDADELSAEGWKEYCLHPVRGQTAIDSIEDLRKAGILIRHHHESYDGTGFPDNLRGAAIPLGARIIAMADYIDRAMGKISVRNTIEQIILSAQEELEKKFDPQIFPYMRKPVTDLYTRLSKDVESSEREFEPGDLKNGMVLSRDVKSGTGLLLLGKGVSLDGTTIEAIKRYYLIDPPPRGVFVWTI